MGVNTALVSRFSNAGLSYLGFVQKLGPFWSEVESDFAWESLNLFIFRETQSIVLMEQLSSGPSCLVLFFF